MKINEIKKRMHSGKLYLADDEEFVHEQLHALDKLFDYNQLKPSM